MSVTVGNIYDTIDSIAPFDTQLDFDRAGLLIGSREMPVTGVTLCLDVTKAAVEWACEHGSQLIVSHHPLIWEPIKVVPEGSVVYMLIANRMAHIAAHTNYDKAACGVNYHLAKCLGLCEIHPIEDCDIAMEGRLPQAMTAEQLAALTAARLGGNVRFTNSAKPIERIAVIGGSGGDYAAELRKLGYDALITGEAKHHELSDAADNDFTMITAGHYETEMVAIPPLAERLSMEFPDVRFDIYKQSPTRSC